MKTEIKNYILNQITHHPKDITRIAANEFNISRQTTSAYINKLIEEGLVISSGNTRARKYELKNFVDQSFYAPIVENIAEDVLWRDNILPLMKGISTNIIEICQYGFTEIIQNTFDHSESESVLYTVQRNAISILLTVSDSGIGIFNKIKRDFNLIDARHALLELSKGKLTTDPKRHSGEGIFFSSRMFDEFCILSNPLFYSRKSTDDRDWLIEVKDSDRYGTFVSMEISPYSTRTDKSVFEKYASGQDNWDFSKTHVPIKLAKYGEELLISRSQAKRILARFEQFSEVFLDFNGIETIGQAFADEIFRVYQMEHPDIRIVWINTTQDIENMIDKVRLKIPHDSILTDGQQHLF